MQTAKQAVDTHGFSGVKTEKVVSRRAIKCEDKKPYLFLKLSTSLFVLVVAAATTFTADQARNLHH